MYIHLQLLLVFLFFSLQSFASNYDGRYTNGADIKGSFKVNSVSSCVVDDDTLAYLRAYEESQLKINSQSKMDTSGNSLKEIPSKVIYIVIKNGDTNFFRLSSVDPIEGKEKNGVKIHNRGGKFYYENCSGRSIKAEVCEDDETTFKITIGK
jgi:hypothetical protein